MILPFKLNKDRSPPPQAGRSDPELQLETCLSLSELWSHAQSARLGARVSADRYIYMYIKILRNCIHTVKTGVRLPNDRTVQAESLL